MCQEVGLKKFIIRDALFELKYPTNSCILSFKRKSAYTDGFLSATAVLRSETQNRKKLSLWFLQLVPRWSRSLCFNHAVDGIACGNSRRWTRSLLSGNRCGLNKKSACPGVCFGRILKRTCVQVWARGFNTKSISRHLYRH